MEHLITVLVNSWNIEVFEYFEYLVFLSFANCLTDKTNKAPVFLENIFIDKR